MTKLKIQWGGVLFTSNSKNSYLLPIISKKEVQLNSCASLKRGVIYG